MRRAGLALLLCALFAGITLGHGLPFVVEGAVFIFVFTTLFSWAEWRADGRVARSGADARRGRAGVGFHLVAVRIGVPGAPALRWTV